MLIAVAFLVVANIIFALRELDVILHSRVAIETKTPSATMPSLSIIVPARNEEHQIEQCVRSLLAMRHPNLEVIVVDDESTDATHAILMRLTKTDRRLTVIKGETLPTGWIGKSWALVQGSRRATGAWLLFTDADTVHEPLAASSAQQWALDGGYDVVSLLPDQETIGIAERLFLPTVLFVILLAVGSLDDINDPRKREAAIFNGQYVLASRDAYDAVGGHVAVRAEIAEDLELARVFKRDGRFRTFLGGANGLVRTRMYHSFMQIWRGFVKNFGIAPRGKIITAVAGVALIAGVSPLSPSLTLILLARREWTAAACLIIAMLLVVGIAEYGMQAMRFRVGAGIALPLGLSLTLAIFVTSLTCIATGRGVEWRGRRYGGVF